MIFNNNLYKAHIISVSQYYTHINQHNQNYTRIDQITYPQRTTVYTWGKEIKPTQFMTSQVCRYHGYYTCKWM